MNDNDIEGAPSKGEMLIARHSSEAEILAVLKNAPNYKNEHLVPYFKAMKIEALRRGLIQKDQ